LSYLIQSHLIPFPSDGIASDSDIEVLDASPAKAKVPSTPTKAKMPSTRPKVKTPPRFVIKPKDNVKAKVKVEKEEEDNAA
jgi:hypothetical protein